MISSASSQIHSAYELALVLSNTHASSSGDTTNTIVSVDPTSLAELCASHMASIFCLIPSTPPTCPSLSRKVTSPSPICTLTAFIAQIISEASCSISVTQTALDLLSHYTATLSALGDPGAYTIPEARALFLAAYMASARAHHDSQPYGSFWARVAGGVYTPAELEEMEREFVEVVQYQLQGGALDSEHEEGYVVAFSELTMNDDKGGVVEGLWMTSSDVAMHDEEGVIAEIPMIDEEDEAMFLRALEPPTLPLILVHQVDEGRKQSRRGQGFRRASRMANES